MQRKIVPIESLLLRTFLPAVVVVAVLLAILVYNLVYSSILDGFERKLVTTSALTGAMIDPEDHDALIALALKGADAEAIEATDRYERNAGPIRRIRSELGLTYLYTQIIGGPSDILYILDGSVGDEHSPIGYEDDLPDDTMAGLANIEKNGSIYVSPIEYQEQWGLLKTAAAPILGGNGRITGSAGADVNISVIQVATQNALFASAMIGLGSILACVVVALALVRRIAKPIEVLTEDTLAIAAGGGNSPAAVPGPREVGELRGALSKLVDKMTRDARANADTVARLNRAATSELIASRLGSNVGAPVTLVKSANFVVTWVADKDPGAQGVLAHRASEHFARHLSADARLAGRWRELADLTHGACIVIDAQERLIELIGTGTPVIAVAGKPFTLEPGLPRTFDPHESVTLTCPGGTVHTIWTGATR